MRRYAKFLTLAGEAFGSDSVLWLDGRWSLTRCHAEASMVADKRGYAGWIIYRRNYARPFAEPFALTLPRWLPKPAPELSRALDFLLAQGKEPHA